MWHPLLLIPEGWPRLVALAILIILIVILARRAPSADPLKPYRLVSLELAGNETIAATIIGAWKDKENTKLNLALALQRLDTLFFIPLYSTLLALVCVMVADWLYARGTLAHTQGILLAYAMWLAAVLDWVENYEMDKMLRAALGTTAEEAVKVSSPALATACASFKFLIIGAGILYLLTGVVARLLQLKSPAP